MRPGERAARAAAYERARPEISVAVPRNARRVLDLGCATGTTGAALKERQDVEVVGVEREPEYAREAARTRLDGSTPPTSRRFDPRGRFDALIAADILEHLVDPWGALRRYAALLEPGATAVVSLPNVGHWSTYAHLARGQLAAPAGGHLRRHPPALVHAARRARAARPGRPGARHGRPPRLDRRRGSRADALAPPLLQVPGIRTLFTFQHVLAAIYAPPACQ